MVFRNIEILIFGKKIGLALKIFFENRFHLSGFMFLTCFKLRGFAVLIYGLFVFFSVVK